MNTLIKILAATAATAGFASCANETASLVEEQQMSSRAGTQADVVLEWNHEEQVIDGFGVAQAGWADYLYAHRKRNEVMDIMFGQNGLRLNILRGEVFPHYDAKTFNLNDNINRPLDDPFFDVDYSSCTDKALEERARREGQLWVTKKAKQEYGVEKLIFSTWTPPAYMKSNGSVSKGYLKRSHYQAYANYLSNFCDAFKKAGLPVYALSPANEPEYSAPWNSCLWLPAATTLGKFIVNNLGPKLAQTSPETKIIFGENAQWTSILGMIMGSKNYVRDILNLNSRITNYPLIAAGHGYIDPVTKKDPAIEPFDKAQQKGIPVWLTEISDPFEKYDKTMTSGLKWAKKWHRY